MELKILTSLIVLAMISTILISAQGFMNKLKVVLRINGDTSLGTGRSCGSHICQFFKARVICDTRLTSEDAYSTRFIKLSEENLPSL